MNHYIEISLIFSLLSYASYAAIQDFCVADYSQPETPTGYKCKKPESVTVKDFVYSGLATPAKPSSLIKGSATFATVDKFPGLNGLGISVNRVDLEVGGFGPIHSHPGANEIIALVSGSMGVGFISSDNTAYFTNLTEGDIMAIPRGLLHYIMNTGETHVTSYSGFSSERPRVQNTDFSLFGGQLPVDILSKVTFIEPAEVKRLIGVISGKNI